MNKHKVFRPLSLAALLAAAGLCPGTLSQAALTKTPVPSRAAYIRETLQGFRSVRESFIGAQDREGGDLLQMAAETAEMQISKDEKEGVVAPTLRALELERQALESLKALARFYSLKLRSPFMKLVHAKFRGNIMTLDAALAGDFRSYRAINARFIPDHVTLAGEEASVDFKFDMILLHQSGLESKSSGLANFTFLLDKDGKMKLRSMSASLFGSSAPPWLNPVAVKQGPPVDSRSGATPGFSGSVVSGVNAVLVAGTNGWRFSRASGVLESQADVFRLSNDLAAANAVVEIGPCDLSTLGSVPAQIAGKFAPLNNLSCYAVRTTDHKYAVMRIKALSGGAAGAATATFDWKLQTNGTPNF